MNKKKVVFRADGNPKIGLGHVSRLIALAEMLKDKYDCSFLIQSPIESLQKQIKEICSQIYILNESSDYLQEAEFVSEKYLEGNEIVVLDGYHFDTGYQKIIKAKGSKLVCIDDTHSYHFVADVVLNHAGNINAGHYHLENYTKLYCGSKYALLRKPHLKTASKNDMENKNFKSIFVNMGGADPQNFTLEVLKELLFLDDIHNIDVVTGHAYSWQNDFQSFLDQVSHPDITINLHSSLSVEKMVALMRKSGIAVCSASTVAYEFCCSKGILILIKTADNQDNIYQYLINSGCAIAFKKKLSQKLNENNNLKMIENQKILFDGKSPIRLIEIFKLLSK